MEQTTFTTNISKLSKTRKAKLIEMLQSVERNLNCEFTYDITDNVLTVTSLEFAVNTVKSIVKDLKGGK